MADRKPSKIPYIFVVFFAVIIAVNFFYIYLSNKTWRGVVTDNSYQKGLHYNDTLQQVEDQKKLGWRIDLKLKKFGTEEGLFKEKLTVTPLDKNGAFISGANIRITFKRPTQEGYDFVQAIPFDNGVYKAEILFPFKGQWDAEIQVRKDDNSFLDAKRIVIE